MKKPKSKKEQLSWKAFFESYFKASNFNIPDFSFETVKNNKDSSLYAGSDYLDRLYETLCLKGTYSPQDVTIPETLETVTVAYEGGQSVVPIVRMNCQIYYANPKGEEVLVSGLYDSAGSTAILSHAADQYTLIHEVTHGHLDRVWRKKGEIDDYDSRKVRADSVLTKEELKITGLGPNSPLSMDMANEMVANALEQIKNVGETDGWSDAMHRVRFALGMNAMNRITSILKNGDRSITDETYEEFDPHHLLTRIDEWIDEPWAAEAAKFASEKSPLSVLSLVEKMAGKPWAKSVFKKAATDNLISVITKAPFLIELLGTEFFTAELDKHPDSLAHIQKEVRQKYWPERKLSSEMAEKLGEDFIQTNPDLFERKVLMAVEANVFNDLNDDIDPTINPEALCYKAERDIKKLLRHGGGIIIGYCRVKEWKNSPLCEQIIKSIISFSKKDELARWVPMSMAIIDSDDPAIYEIFDVFHKDNPKKFPAQLRLWARIRKGFIISWQFRILEKYGVITEDLRATIKRIRGT